MVTVIDSNNDAKKINDNNTDDGSLPIQTQVQARMAAYKLKLEQRQRRAEQKTQQQEERRQQRRHAKQGAPTTEERVVDQSHQPNLPKDQDRAQQQRQRHKKIQRTLSRDVDNEYRVVARVERHCDDEARALALQHTLESYRQQLEEKKAQQQAAQRQETTRRRRIRRQRTLEEQEQVGKELADMKAQSGLDHKSSSSTKKEDNGKNKESGAVHVRKVRGGTTSPRQPRQLISAGAHPKEAEEPTTLISERAQSIAEKKKLLRTRSQELAQEDVKARFETQRRRQEEQRAQRAAQRRTEEAQAEEAAQQPPQPQKTVADRIRDSARRRAEEEVLEQTKAQRRKQDEAQAKLDAERRTLELARANRELHKIEAQERAERERMEAERKRRELAEAVKEAKAREVAVRERQATMKRAFEEQEKAIAAADAVRAKAKADMKPADTDQDIAIGEESETDDDEDEDWSEEANAKIIADTKKEVDTYSKKCKAEERQTIAMKESLVTDDNTQTKQRQALISDTTSDYRLEDKAAGSEDDGDEETKELVESIQKARAYVASLEVRQNRIADREARQIQAIEDKLEQQKKRFWDRETKGLVRRTLEEEEHLRQRADAARQTVDGLRNANKTIREKCSAMEQDMRRMAIQTGTLKRERASIVAYTALVSHADDYNTGQREKIDAVTKMLIKAIDEHTEALEMRAIYGDTEHKIRSLYDRLNNDLLMKFENECTDSGLVLELLKVGEEETGEGKNWVSASSILSTKEDDTDLDEGALFEEMLGG